jgi:hypothetical protein
VYQGSRPILWPDGRPDGQPGPIPAPVRVNRVPEAAGKAIIRDISQ